MPAISISAKQAAQMGLTAPKRKRVRVPKPLPRLFGQRVREIEHLFIPWPPSMNNGYWCRARNGGVYLSATGKAFRENVMACVLESCCGHVEGRLHVEIYLHSPDYGSTNWDIDNRAKATLDALQHAGVFADDKQIDSLKIVRGNGCVRVCNAPGGAGVFIREIFQ